MSIQESTDMELIMISIKTQALECRNYIIL